MFWIYTTGPSNSHYYRIVTFLVGNPEKKKKLYITTIGGWGGEVQL